MKNIGKFFDEKKKTKRRRNSEKRHFKVKGKLYETTNC